MSADLSVQQNIRRISADGVAARSDFDVLRTFVIAAGLVCSVLFVVVGIGYGLQEYADGSIFSYAVAVQDAWAFHWHNISSRVLVYLFCFVPAEAYVGLFRDPAGGIALYGFLFYVGQALGLALTFATDRSNGRIIFTYACASTACLCPLVFGFPTEMWMAHALFWPALAICHYGSRSKAGWAATFAVLLALVLTHGGAVVFGVAILCTMLLRGLRDAATLRVAIAFLLAMVVWDVIKVTLPPGAYFGNILMAAALNFIDVAGLIGPVCLLLLGALASYGLLYLILHRWIPTRAGAVAAVIVAAGLAAYWVWLDRSLLTDHRYAFRTALLIFTPVLGGLAASFALRSEGQLKLPVPLLPQVLTMLSHPAAARLAAGAVALVLLIHGVETAKFVTAWTDYKAAVRALAMGPASDPSLGDPRFVSSARINPDLNRFAWFSTTPYLSVLVAPGLAPKQLVVDPEDSYFWLSCATATANEAADLAVPRQSRSLVRVYACQHRP